MKIVTALKNEKGQASLVFIASLVIIMACFALLVDGGRYLVMRNRARMMADASALSGASVLDVQKAGEGTFVLQSGKVLLSFNPDLMKILQEGWRQRYLMLTMTSRRSGQITP